MSSKTSKGGSHHQRKLKDALKKSFGLNKALVDRYFTGTPSRLGGIGLPEITFGLVPTGGGTQMLARLVGSGTTLEALLASRLFTPEEAHLAGIVQRRVK